MTNDPSKAAYLISRSAMNYAVEDALDFPFLTLMKHHTMHRRVDREIWASSGFDAIQTIVNQFHGWKRWK